MSKKHSPTQNASTASTTASDPDATDETSESLSKDEMFELLKNRRRRDALRYLAEGDGESTLSDLAERIAAKENDVEVHALSSAQRKRVYIGLYQCHLPKLADAGIVDFEKHRGDVERLDAAAQLDPYLDGTGDDDADADAESADQDAQDADGPTDAVDPVGLDTPENEGWDGERDAATESDPASLPSSLDQPHDRTADHRLLAGATVATALAGLAGAPLLRRLPDTVWTLVGTVAAFVAARR